MGYMSDKIKAADAEYEKQYGDESVMQGYLKSKDAEED